MKPKRADTAWVAVGAVVAGGAGFAFNLLLARGAGAAGAGVVLALTTWFTLLLGVGKLGMDTTSVREGGRLRAGAEGAGLDRVQRWTMLPALGISVLLALLIIGSAGQLAGWLIADAPVPLEPLIIASALCLPPGVYTIVRLGLLRGLGVVREYVAIEQLWKPLARILGAAALVALGIVSASGYLATWLIPVVVAAAATWWVAARRIGRAEQTRSDPGERARIWRFAATRAGSQILDIANTSIGTLVLAAAATATVTGQFATAFRIVVAGQLAFQAMRLLVAPSLAAFLAARNTKAADEVFGSASALIVYAAWPIFLVCLVFPEAVLSVFGEDFLPAAPALRVLSLSGLFLAIVGNQGSVVLMSGLGATAMRAVAAAVVVNLAITVGLTAQWGALAAAWGWTCATLVEGLLLAVAVRQLGMRPFPLAARSAAVRTVATVVPALLAIGLIWPAQPAVAVVIVIASAVLWLHLCARSARAQLYALTGTD